MAFHRLNCTPLLALFVLLFSAGCGPVIDQASARAPRAATPVVMDESLKAMEDARTRERVAALMATPELQQTLRELGAAVGPGVLDGLSTEESKARIDALAKDLVTAVVRAMVAETKTVTHEAIAAISEPEVQRTLDQMVAMMAKSATHSAIRAAADDIPTTLSPAIRKVLADSVSSPEMRAAASLAAHDIAQGAVFGSRDAVTEMDQKKPVDGGLVERITGMLVKAGWAVVLISALVVGLVAAGMLSLRARAIRSERASEESSRKMRKILELLVATDAGDWPRSVRRSLEEELYADAPASRREHRANGASRPSQA